MNTLKCSQCKHYDPIKSGRTKNAVHGWCAVKSVYPHREGAGQTFPAGVKRAASPEDLAKPVIVEGEKVVASCTAVTKK